MVALCLLQPWQGKYDHSYDHGHERDEGGGYDEDVDCDDIDDVDDYHNYNYSMWADKLEEARPRLLALDSMTYTKQVS